MSEECPAQARPPPSFCSRGPEKPAHPPTCVLGGAVSRYMGRELGESGAGPSLLWVEGEVEEH